MTNQRTISPIDQAVTTAPGGCLSIYSLPIFSIGIVSVFMMVFLGKLSFTTEEKLTIPNNSALINDSPPAEVIETDSINYLSPVFTKEIEYWTNSILSWSHEYSVDPNLIATVMQIESCGDPKAVSRSGAMSLFQVMPYHFVEIDDPFDPDTNALRGISYLKKSIETSGGDIRLTFAGYNGGIGVIDRSEDSWAEETRRYAYWGSGIYYEASSGNIESSRLGEWLAVGGISLCKQAHQRLGLP